MSSPRDLITIDRHFAAGATNSGGSPAVMRTSAANHALLEDALKSTGVGTPAVRGLKTRRASGFEASLIMLRRSCTSVVPRTSRHAFLLVALLAGGCLERLQPECPTDRFVPGPDAEDTYYPGYPRSDDTGLDTGSADWRCRNPNTECSFDETQTVVACRGVTDPWCDPAYGTGHYCVDTTTFLDWVDANVGRDQLLCSNSREPQEPHGWYVECREP